MHSQPMNGHEALLLNRLLDQADESRIQLDRIERRLIDGDEKFKSYDIRLGKLEGRAATPYMEMIRPVLAFLGQVATPKQWVGGALIYILLLKGIINPEMAWDIVLKLLGLPLPS